VYIDYYTGTRKMTVEETYKYFPEDWSCINFLLHFLFF
jgi:hypothetical protein